MKIKYDFHIHSCLSPCGDEDMTPNNIAAMAKLLELDAIAVTDHNTVGNCRSVIEAGEAHGLLVLAGMELTTAEEIHVICLFADIEQAEAFGDFIYTRIPDIHNNPEIFGYQLYMDSSDIVVAEEQKLLITATAISVDHIKGICADYGGVCYPAHIDRPSNSILSSFGIIEDSFGFDFYEVADRGKIPKLKTEQPILNKKTIMVSSDAHRLETLAVMEHSYIELPELTRQGIIDYFKEKH